MAETERCREGCDSVKLAGESRWALCPRCKSVYRVYYHETHHYSTLTAGKLLAILEADLDYARHVAKTTNYKQIEATVIAEIEKLKAFGIAITDINHETLN